MEPRSVKSGPGRSRHDKPLVGTSACLLGEPVRYDGQAKRSVTVAEELSRHVALRRYCPEVGIGLPVPRPPIQLVRFADGVRVRGVEQPDEDYTAALTDHADSVTEPLCGFVLKARSPSCGLGTTPLFDRHDREIDTTSGAFAARIRERFPEMPLCDEEDLEDPDFLREFIRRVYLYRDAFGVLGRR